MHFTDNSHDSITGKNEREKKSKCAGHINNTSCQWNAPWVECDLSTCYIPKLSSINSIFRSFYPFIIGKVIKMEQHPQEHANFLSKITFFWLFDLFKFGHSNEITANDIPSVRQADSSAKLTKRFYALWNCEINSGRGSLWRVLVKLYAAKVTICGFLFSVLDTICRCVFINTSRINFSNINKRFKIDKLVIQCVEVQLLLNCRVIKKP